MDDTPQVVAPHVEAAAPSVEHSPLVGYSRISVGGRYFSIDYAAISAAHHVWSRRGFELAVGGRLGLGSRSRGLPAIGEGFVAAFLAPSFATLRDTGGRTMSWRPALGVEVGVSSAGAQYDPPPALQEHFRRASPNPGWLYAQAVARPVRFRLSRFQASVLGVGIGMPIGQFGRYLRVELDLLQVGVVL
jgi:hypothetical protein